MEHINLSVLDGVLDRYQAHLDATRPKEVYKWEAVKHFKETYNPAVDDLSAMLVDTFQVGGKEKLNLAFGPSWFPIGMLDWFIQVDSRGAFAALDALWDESGDLRTRMVEFEAWAKGMLDSINAEQIAAGIDPAKSHFQDSRSMSLYLAFMHPESHYLYKTRMYTDAAKFLGVGWPGNKFDKVIAYREMCGQILEHLEASRRDLIEESDRILGELTEYDPNHHMLVQDIVYFITKYDKDYRDASGEGEEPADDGWFPSAEEYDPGIDADCWEGLLNNSEVFTAQALEIVCRLRDHGDSATCSQLAQRYGETKNYYLAGSVTLAKRVAETTGCPLPNDEENSRWWPILYVGRHATKDEAGSYVWKLRDELREAMDRVDLSSVSLYAKVDAGGENLVPEEGDNPVAPAEEQEVVPAYSEEEFLSDVYVTEDDLADMKELLRRKRNLILQGSPGTGKTYCARRLAWAMMGCMDDSRITFVQFHQSTTYDDFVSGYRPDGNGGFTIKDGPFVRACHRALRDPDPKRPHFVIIDEINRANISKVLGELLVLIEADHRGESVLLTVADGELSVPKNLYIIGMMNTADRGLALIDYALRRRFAFFDMAPALGHPKFLEQLAGCGDPHMAALVKATEEVNKDIAADAALGEGFRIGHSYFCGAKDARLVLRYELAPLVREYWFDDHKKMQQELDKLGQALK